MMSRERKPRDVRVKVLDACPGAGITGTDGQPILKPNTPEKKGREFSSIGVLPRDLAEGYAQNGWVELNPTETRRHTKESESAAA